MGGNCIPPMDDYVDGDFMEKMKYKELEKALNALYYVDEIIAKDVERKVYAVLDQYKSALKAACSCRPGGGYCSACTFLYNENQLMKGSPSDA